MGKRVFRGVCLAGLLGGVSAALAAPGVVPGGVTLFAGPSPAYPVVAGLPPGTPVEVFGCQPGWGWCDVANGPYRGWAAGSQVELLYNDAPAPLESYGPVIGLPLLGFAFGSYWGAHYRHEPWFAGTDRWGGGRGGFGPPPPGGFRGEPWHGGPPPGGGWHGPGGIPGHGPGPGGMGPRPEGPRPGPEGHPGGPHGPPPGDRHPR